MKKTAKMKILSGTMAAILLSLISSHAQLAPLNDNFADRIYLSGNDISFEGTLVGATLESDPYEIVFPDLGGTINGTIWWEWTAPESTIVTIEIKNPSQPLGDRGNGLGVYDLVDVGNGKIIGGFVINTRWPRMLLTFQAMPGTNYQIQLAGSDSVNFSFRLIATNHPSIIEQPKHQAISANDSVMFGVVAVGLRPFGYQWQRNGTNLPGETAAILGLDNVTPDSAGAYRVIITNSSGTTISDQANLVVSPTDIGGELVFTQAGSNSQFAFRLSGDIGRRYRLQSSTDLMNWNAESSFPSSSFYDVYQSTAPMRSVVSDLTGDDSYNVPQVGTQRFYRLTSFHAANEICNNNLKKIRFAQLIWSCLEKLEITTAVSWVDLIPHLKNSEVPLCPSNGNYFLYAVLDNPTCTVTNHLFEER